MIDVIHPPAIYDVAFPGRLTQHVDSLKILREECIALGSYIPPGRIIYGCSKRFPPEFNGPAKSCLIVIPEVGGEISAADQELTRRHELAHCNGWPADHSVPK